MPPTPVPGRHRRSTSGWWTGYGIALSLTVPALLLAWNSALQVRALDSEDLLARAAVGLYIGIMGVGSTAVATTLAVVAVTLACVGLRGPARWIAALVAGLVAVGSLVALAFWFLPWVL